MFSSDIFNTKSIQTLGKKSLLGQGASGCVIKPPVIYEYPKKYMEYENASDSDVAKLFRTELYDDFKAELKILIGIHQKLDPQHVFTVSLKGANVFPSNVLTDKTVLNCLEKYSSEEPTEIYQIIMEDGGKELKQIPKSSISYDKFLQLFKVFLSGIQKMHSGNSRLVHRDIKPVNVLMSDTKISLIDFGISDIATNIYDKDSKIYLEYIYPYYPPEFYIASLLLKYRNNKPRFLQKLDGVIDIMQKNYFKILFKESQIPNIRNQLQDFINHIKLKDYGYHDVFNEQLAYKCDIYGIGFVLRELANKISYTSEKQKIVVYNLYNMCSEINPYKRTSLEQLITYMQDTIGDTTQKTDIVKYQDGMMYNYNIMPSYTLPVLPNNTIEGGKKKSKKTNKPKMRRLYIAKKERNDCNKKTPPRCKRSCKACCQ
jgi:serine/threonine protein kinase